jgi:hypothetical protein
VVFLTRALIVVVAGLGLGACEAQAANVRLYPNTQIGEVSFTLRYFAYPGEANRLTVVASPDSRVWTFREAGAFLHPGDNCAAGGDGAIACTVPATVAAPLTSHVVLELGDGDDVVDVSTAHSAVSDLQAGEGDDRLRVRSGFVNASMGPGRRRGARGRRPAHGRGRPRRRPLRDRPARRPAGGVLRLRPTGARHDGWSSERRRAGRVRQRPAARANGE